jgi:hypothetical protein
VTNWKVYWGALFASLFAVSLWRNNRKYQERSRWFRGGKAALDVGAAALVVSILGFFLEGVLVIGAVATALIAGKLLHRRRTANQERGNRIPISANAVWTIFRVPGNTPRGEGKHYGVTRGLSIVQDNVQLPVGFAVTTARRPAKILRAGLFTPEFPSCTAHRQTV